MKNILLKKALKELKEEFERIERIERIRQDVNKMRFDDDKSKEDMADSLNEIYKTLDGISYSNILLEGIEELLHNQKVLSW